MPNIISKILHRKSRSGSSSGSTSDLTSPSSHGLVVSRDRAGASTIRLDDRFDGGPASPESRRKSMSAARGSPASPSAPARKSLDARPNGIYVNPARPAPPPPVPGAESHGVGVASTHRNGADASTVVIDGRADPRQGPSYAQGSDAHETTASSGNVFSTPQRPVHRDDDADAAGQFDRRGLFDDTPAASTALDHFSTSPSGAHALDLTREAYAPPGPVDHFPNDSRELDLDRDLPPLPRNPSHEIKQVDSRRRPTMSETGPRQSVEGEMGRESMDAADRERGSRPLSDVRGMERSINEEDPRASALPAGKERTSLDIPTRGSSLRHAGANGIDADESVEGRMAGLSVNDSAKGQAGTAGASGGMDALERQRMELVGSIVNGAEQRRLQRGELSPEGVKIFEKAGMGHLVGKASTVDVTTQWLKPVVHETIIPRIHTEYTTIITREIHRHHVYPKIQPIEDPNPIVLPPLHRIFSPQTGKWHEVQGDDAAIAILGEDVFRNGPKEVRHVRNPVDNDVLRRESNEDISIPPVGPDGSGISTVAPATQAGRARVVEREGILGGEMGEWKKTERGHLFGKLRDEVGRAM